MSLGHSSDMHLRREGGSHRTPARENLPAVCVRFLASRHLAWMPGNVPVRICSHTGDVTIAGNANTPPLAAGELYYHLPESAHDDLSQIRDELGLLANLALRTCCDEGETLQLSSAALSQCFARLSVEMTEALEQCLSPSKHAALGHRSRH